MVTVKGRVTRPSIKLITNPGSLKNNVQHIVNYSFRFDIKNTEIWSFQKDNVQYSILWILYLDFNLDWNPKSFFVLSWPWVTPDVCPWSQNFCLNIINNANTQMCSLEMFSGLWIFHINVWNGNSVEQKTSLILRGKGTEQVLATHMICIIIV